MKIYLTDQSKNFARHLEFLQTKAVMPYDKNGLTEKTSIIHIDNKRAFENLDLEFLFAYKIFPENIMSFLTQWEVEKRAMQAGDTIVQQVYLPPIKSFSQKIIFGVRISEIINEPGKKGFSYETLDGHVEKGISTFTVEQIENETIFKIQTYSSPGNIVTKLLGPVFSIPYQTFCTKAALRNVKLQLENA